MLIEFLLPHILILELKTGFISLNGSNFREIVRFKDIDLVNVTDCTPGIVKVCTNHIDFGFKRIHYHPNIPVVLVELADRVTDDEDFSIFPACLPTDETSSKSGDPSLPILTAGWGASAVTKSRTPSDNVLRQSKTKIVPCEPAEEGVICVREPLDWSGGCVVDPGGPLMAVGPSGDPEFDIALISVIGIDTGVKTSSCSSPEETRRFYHVPNFRDWILKTIALYEQ